MFELNYSMLPFLNQIHYSTIGLTGTCLRADWSAGITPDRKHVAHLIYTWPAKRSWELQLDKDDIQLSRKGEEELRLKVSECLSKPQFEFLIIPLADVNRHSFARVDFSQELSSSNFYLLPLEFRVQILYNKYYTSLRVLVLTSQSEHAGSMKWNKL